MIWECIIFGLCDDKLKLLGDYTCSKLFWVLPCVFNGPFFIFLTCETGVYLQVYVHLPTARGRLRSLKCSQVMGTRLLNGERMEKTWKELWLYEPS